MKIFLQVLEKTSCNFSIFIPGWELLRDPSGRDHFLSFLEKEYATENLLFVEAVWKLKKLPSCEVAAECRVIWNSFMARHANHPVNVDSKSYKITEENMRNPDRYTVPFYSFSLINLNLQMDF